MSHPLLTILLIISHLVVFGQAPALPNEAKHFLLPGYEMLDYKQGDLNADKRPDAIMILKQTGEDSLIGEETVRPFIILVRQADGKLKQVLRNDSLVMCRHCGGMMGDPYQQTDIHHSGFSIYFYGGSAWRWAYEYRFEYRIARNNWYLVLESQSSFNSGDPDMTMKEVNIKETELGEVPASQFNSQPKYEDSRWKVNTLKTYFFDSPQLGSKPRKGYLVKDNKVTGIRHLKNFIEVSYDNGKAVITTGYLLKKDLVRIQ